MTRPPLPRRSLLLATPALLVINRAAAAQVLSFEEDFSQFSAAASGPARWRTQFGGSGPRALRSRAQPGNGDRQVYVDQEMLGATGIEPLGLQPFELGRHGLDIIARPTPAALLPRLWNQPFTSGLITTRGSYLMKQGRIRINAAMPFVPGARASFWLASRQGHSQTYIAIASTTGRAPGEVRIGIGSAERSSVAAADRAVPLAGRGEAPRSYGLDWAPERITWLIDEAEVASIPTPADLQTSMYLLIGLSVGDRWAGPAATEGFEAGLRVSRVWASTPALEPGFLASRPAPLRLAEGGNER